MSNELDQFNQDEMRYALSLHPEQQKTWFQNFINDTPTRLDMEGRDTFFPFKYSNPELGNSVMNQREWALPGIVARGLNLFTAPTRSVTDPEFKPEYEAAEFGLGTMGGGLGLSHAAPAPSGSIGMATRTAPNLVEHFHGSDTKGLTVLDPAASQGRRSEGSSVWFKNNPAEAAEYPKKNSGVVYTAPLDTSNFAVVDANFTSNKAIHPDAVIYHSNGETTPVSMLGEKVTTDAIAAHSRAKGDPGVRILNVGDKGSGRVRSEEPYGESVAVHSPVKPTAERTLKEIEQPNTLTPEHLDALKEYAAGYFNSKVGGYSQIQNILRTGLPRYKDADLLQSDKIASVFSDAFNQVSTETPQTVYRGVRIPKGSEFEQVLNLKPGDIYTDKGATSTSKDPSIVARKFSDPLNRSDKIVNFVIDVPKGSRSLDLEQYLGSKYGHEKEVVLAPNTKFEITKVSTGAGLPRGNGMPQDKNIRTIHMRVTKDKSDSHAKGGRVSFADNLDTMRYELRQRQ